MVKTQTELTEAEARERLAVLSAKAREFYQAIDAFGSEYDCDTVGLGCWMVDIDGVLDEIKEDIDNTFPSEGEDD